MNIDMFWFRHISGRTNFGDELSPWIVRSLAPGSTIRWVEPRLGEVPLWLRVARVAKAQVRPKAGPFPIRYAHWHALLRRPSLLAVGSIIRRAVRSNTQVWGSGIISVDDDIVDGQFLAVRGPRTQARLLELGLDAPEAMGDPGLLVPRLFKTAGSISSEVTLIPHFLQYEAIAAASPPGVRVLDLAASIETILHAIAESSLTLSTSLHGVILSHAFGVPSLWVSVAEAAGIGIGGDDIKFPDYFESVGIPPYSAVSIENLPGASKHGLRRLVDGYFGATLPAEAVIAERQRDLLLTAPFPRARALLEI